MVQAEHAEIHVSIIHDVDVALACQHGRTMARQAGFSESEQAMVVIAVSEAARNIVKYAHYGEVTLSLAQHNGQTGIVITAQDEGPGIPDIEQALQDGYSTGGGLGLGLPGIKRLMDEMVIMSEVGQGTHITMKKWKRHG